MLLIPLVLLAVVVVFCFAVVFTTIFKSLMWGTVLLAIVCAVSKAVRRRRALDRETRMLELEKQLAFMRGQKDGKPPIIRGE
jgi:hypothetical protein